MLGYPLGHSGLLPTEGQGRHDKLGLYNLILWWGLRCLITGWGLGWAITLGWRLGNSITLGWCLGNSITLRWSLRYAIIIGGVLWGLWYSIAWWCCRGWILWYSIDGWTLRYLIARWALRCLWHLRWSIIVHGILRYFIGYSLEHRWLRWRGLIVAVSSGSILGYHWRYLSCSNWYRGCRWSSHGRRCRCTDDWIK